MWIAVEETNMELSDPRSYEHYLSGSENKAWNIYMIFTYLQLFIRHFKVLLRTNIMTSSQLTDISSVGRALHQYHSSRPWVQILLIGLKFFQALFPLLLK